MYSRQLMYGVVCVLEYSDSAECECLLLSGSFKPMYLALMLLSPNVLRM
jgi:hypothetical protein